MIIASLVLCFLLSFLPLVIGTLSFRYAKNIFSGGILMLSATSFLLGLAQFSLLLLLNYELLSQARAVQATQALNWVSIAGGTVMIFAGLLWVGYFRVLMKAKAPVKQIRRVEVPAEQVERVSRPARPVSMKPRPKAEPVADLFGEELVGSPMVRLAAEVGPRKRATAGAAPRKKKS